MCAGDFKGAASTRFVGVCLFVCLFGWFFTSNSGMMFQVGIMTNRILPHTQLFQTKVKYRKLVDVRIDVSLPG